jgi:proprotein convertase subtilisin/kexin type 2
MEVDARLSDISINSWGGEDFTGQYQSLDGGDSEVWANAMKDALKTGRNGKGTIFVWSGGNGTNMYHEVDNSNYDGQANFYGVIAVCAVDKKGKKSVYSERGANLWVCAPSSSTTGVNSYEMITTDVSGHGGMNFAGQSPDLADKDYTLRFGGTSASAALAGGAVALMLESNPNLTWRDVKIILAERARKNDAKDKGWLLNAGKKISDGTAYYINDEYGFGIVDAARAVSLSKKWANVPPMKTYESRSIQVDQNIANESLPGLRSAINIQNSGIHYIEYVDIYLSSDIRNAGDLTNTLISPSGTKSLLAEPHECIKNLRNVPCVIPAKWRYGSARMLGENPNGIWRLVLENNSRQGINSQSIKEWKLKVYGY